MVIGRVGLRFATGPALTGIVKAASIQTVQIAGAPLGTTTFKVVYVTRHTPALYSTGGAALYRYLPATGSWRPVSHISASGIYAVQNHGTLTQAERAASSHLKQAAVAPTSGSSSTGTMALVGLGALLVLVFGFAAFRTRRQP